MERSWIPIFERVQQMLNSPYAVLLVVGLATALLFMLLALGLRWYRLLLFLLICGQMFNLVGGPSQGMLTLVRFGAMFCLCLIGLPGLLSLGPTQYLLLFCPLYMLVFSPRSLVPLWSFQYAAASFFLVLGVTTAVVVYVTDQARARKLLSVIVIASLAWIVLNMVFSGRLEGNVGAGRFTGFTGKTGTVAAITGFLPPFLLWGCFQPWKRLYRYTCLAGLIVSLPMLVLIGQRIGLFAALIGITPLVWLRINANRLLGGVAVLVAAGVASLILFQFLDTRVQHFLLDKYVHRVTHLSDRENRWHAILAMCLEDPWLGKGAGMAELQAKMRVGGAGAHQSYLCMWHDAGITGLLVWVSAMIIALVQSVRFLTRRAPPEMKDMMRLLLGSLLSLMALGFFESSLTSPSNFNVFLLVLCIAMIDRLTKLQREARAPAAATEPWLASKSIPWQPRGYAGWQQPAQPGGHGIA